MPRSHPLLQVLLTSIALAACGEVSGGVSGAGPTASQQFELRLAVEDEVESALSALTVAEPGLPPSFTGPAGCPAISDTTDSDDDTIPDDATLTFLDPPCSVTGLGGGDWSVTGALRIRDTSATTTRYVLDYTDLAWSYTDSAATRTYTATRNGTRVRLGTTSGASLQVDVTIDRDRPNRATATVDLATTVSYLADTPGSVAVGQPLPDGLLSIAGSLGWQRSTENWSLAVATTQALVYDADCDTTPQRIKGGKVTLTGTVNGQAGVLTLTWTGCGVPPSRSWAAGAV